MPGFRSDGADPGGEPIVKISLVGVGEASFVPLVCTKPETGFEFRPFLDDDRDLCGPYRVGWSAMLCGTTCASSGGCADLERFEAPSSSVSVRKWTNFVIVSIELEPRKLEPMKLSVGTGATAIETDPL